MEKKNVKKVAVKKPAKKPVFNKIKQQLREKNEQSKSAKVKTIAEVKPVEEKTKLRQKESVIAEKELIETQPVSREEIVVADNLEDGLEEEFLEEQDGRQGVDSVPQINDISDKDIKKLGLNKEFLQDDIPSEAFDPLSKNVVEMEYTKGNDISLGDDAPQEQYQDQEQQDFGGEQQSQMPPAKKIVPSQPKAKRTHQPAENFGSNAGSGFDDSPDGQQEGAFADESELFPSQDTSSDDEEKNKMTDKEKRKNTKKTVEILLTTYQNLFPIPFLYFSKVSEKKLIVLQRNNEIDVEMVVQSDGTTVKSYIDTYNENCNERFVVTEQMLDDIREPLFDYLMENDMQLTPAQRLMIAVGNHVIAFGQGVMELKTQMNAALDQFKVFHIDMMTQINQAYSQSNNHANQAQSQPIHQSNNASAQAQPEAKTQPVKEENKEEEKVTMENFVEAEVL